MEVASPLTFAHNAAGTKRSLVCSPGSPFSSGMDLTDDNVHQRAFKRRRFQPDTTMDSAESSSTFSPFMNASYMQNKSMFAGNDKTGTSSMKRCRQDAMSLGPNQSDLERLVETQASEIEHLKNAKSNLESSLTELKGEHEKTLNENRILKRAVTIQQERQSQAANDLEAARQYKVDAEQNIRRLEQMILSLRYHLQAQQPQNGGNDFMHFPPPDVY